jgi:superfamily II DNA or RNA helicase
MNKDQIQSDALLALNKVNRGTAAISMGVGKTMLGLKHMVHNYTDVFKCLVVAPKLSIFKSWENDAKDFNLEYLMDHVNFTTYLSLNKQSLDYDVIYLDEVHNLLDSHSVWLSKFKGKIIGLTGTPPRHKNSEKGKMLNKYCPVVYTYITDDAVEDHILNDYEVNVHTLYLDSSKTMLVKTKAKSFYASELDNYRYWTNRCNSATSMKEKQITRVMRMKAMMEYKSKERLATEILNKNTEKTIVFANTQDQADRLCTYSYHSNNPQSEDNLEQFKLGNISELSCVLQLNEGVNIPDLKRGIILHSYGNERKLRQRLGRLLRLNPDDTSTIDILCYKDTVDETWVKNALEDLDQNKITWL